MPLTTSQILALQRLPGVGTQTILNKIAPLCSACLNDLDVRDLVLQIFKGKKKELSREQVSQAFIDAYRVLEQSADFGAKVISYYEPDFPQGLRNAVTDKITAKGEAKREPVLVIYCLGDSSLLAMDNLAIIGSRQCSEQGRSASFMMAQEFAKLGFCIVSGLAAGCDAAAHEGALSVPGGKTIAVLGHGLDMVYPPENEPLAHKIIESGGLLISEYPLGTKPAPYNFVARDRIQAALAKATLLVESSRSGGSMIAAKATFNARKPLFVMQYRDVALNNSPQTGGNHYLASLCGARYLGGYATKAQMTDSLFGVAQSIRGINSGPGFTGDLFGDLSVPY